MPRLAWYAHRNCALIFCATELDSHIWPRPALPSLIAVWGIVLIFGADIGYFSSSSFAGFIWNQTMGFLGGPIQTRIL